MGIHPKKLLSVRAFHMCVCAVFFGWCSSLRSSARPLLLLSPLRDNNSNDDNNNNSSSSSKYEYSCFPLLLFPSFLLVEEEGERGLRWRISSPLYYSYTVPSRARDIQTRYGWERERGRKGSLKNTII